MKKRIVMITGSPRKDGNTNTLAEAFRSGAEAAGHDSCYIEENYSIAARRITDESSFETMKL
ncbi:MAG: hypothetical protein IJ137_08710 [Eubacterium sp.]|nr:hypothetical protein [Eubacterium sp.]